MVATLRHRGPDDKGIGLEGRAGLAHARLSIIDLSPAGHQPMANADGTVWLTFNGEIYNFAEMRPGSRKRHRFRGRSDTEVIVNGWQPGPDGLLRSRHVRAGDLGPARNGWCSRAIVWQEAALLRATADAVRFGSEQKAIQAGPGMPRAPDLSTIHRYLTWGYVPAPYTAFKGIRKLSAAHYLVVEARADGFVQSELVRYWRLPEPRNVRRRSGIADLRRELVGQIEDAVRLRMVSDVPLGAFLSGGVDSPASWR